MPGIKHSLSDSVHFILNYLNNGFGRMRFKKPIAFNYEKLELPDDHSRMSNFLCI
jgi:hypothetical protein